MNFKKLIEKRNELVEKINAMFATAEQENRAFSEEETSSYESMTKEIKDIDATIRMAEAAKGLGDGAKAPAPQAQNAYEKESRAFAAYLRSGKITTEVRLSVKTLLLNTAISFTLDKALSLMFLWRT